MTLPEEVVRRDLPRLRHPDDERLFAAERERVLPAVETQAVSGVFFPEGWQDDFVGLKGRMRRALNQVRTRSQACPFSERQPLIATDRFSNGYFHWVTETLSRLWWVKDELSRLELLLPTFAKRFPYMTESLTLFPELSYRIAAPGVRWRLTDALLAPATALGGNYRPSLVQEVGRAWRTKAAPRAPFRKLYISRSQAARRRIANEAEVIGVLERNGFEIVRLEGMAFANQVRLLAETSHVISNHGAGLTNMLFMVPGTRVTEIRLTGDAHNNCYFSLARALGLDYDYRLGRPAAGTDPHTADLLVDAQDLR